MKIKWWISLGLVFALVMSCLSLFVSAAVSMTEKLYADAEDDTALLELTWSNGSAEPGGSITGYATTGATVIVSAPKGSQNTTTLSIKNLTSFTLRVTVDSDSEEVAPQGSFSKTYSVSSVEKTFWDISYYEEGSAEYTITAEKVLSDSVVTFKSAEGSGTAYVNVGSSTDSSGNAITVPGSTKTATDSFETVGVVVPGGQTLSYVAEPDEGYDFFGFFCSDGRYRGTDAASGSIEFSASMTLTPVFLPKTRDYAMFQTSDSVFPYLDQAITMANDGDKKIVLIEGGTAYHSKNGIASGTVFDLISGVTLVLPYAPSDTAKDPTACDASDGKFPYANYKCVTAAEQSILLDPSKAWIQMTLAEGNTLNLNGQLSIGSMIYGEINFPGATAGTSTAGFAKLVLAGENSKVVVGQNGVLSVCGYITGDGYVDATASGAKVYQVFSILDYNGGGYTAGAAAGSAGTIKVYDGKISVSAGLNLNTQFPGGEYIFPLSRWSMRNIQVKLLLKGSSDLSAYIDLYTSGMSKSLGVLGEVTLEASHNQSVVKMIGANGSGALLCFGSANASITILYDSSKAIANDTILKYLGQTSLQIDGGQGTVSFSELTMSITVLDAFVTLKSSIATFSLPYNFHVQMENGTFSIDNNLAVLPGASLVVGEDAELVVSANAKLIIVDGLYSHRTGQSGTTLSLTLNADGYYPYGGYRPYPKSESLVAYGFAPVANLILTDNGKFTVKSSATFGGIVQATSDNATLVVESGANLTAVQQFGLVGTYKIVAYGVSIKEYVYAGAVVRTIKAQVYSSASGDLVDLATGTYYSHADAQYVKTSYQQGVYANSAEPLVVSLVETFTYSATFLGEWYTDGQIYGYEPKYRVQDYVWLNATFKPSTGFVTFFNNTDTDGDGIITLTDGSQIVCVVTDAETVFYHVRKMHSDDLGSTSLTVTANGQTVNMTFNRAYDSLDPTDANYQAKKDLVDAMIKYGQAADLYFEDEEDSMPALVGTPSATTVTTLAPVADAYSPIAGVVLATKGASVYFPECLRLGVGFALNEGTLAGTTLTATDGQTYTVLQMGLLVGNPGFTGGVLKTNPGCYDEAILLYDGVNNKDAIADGDANNYPNTVYPKDEMISVGAIPALKNERWTAIFDMPSLTYTSRYNVRPFMVVLDATGKTYCIYGAQYVYGLQDYVARQYKTSENNEFKNLLYYTWEYALAAQVEGAFAE